MRTADLHNTAAPRLRRNWVLETIVVAGIVGFGLFVLALEGQISFAGQPPAGVALPYELTR
mgnify:CR=1 FL=1